MNDNNELFDVAMVPCADYDEAGVLSAVGTAVEAAGGLGWVRPGMRVALKTNMVGIMRPETAAVTHPAVVKAVASLLTARGAEVVVGDSPGGPFGEAFISRAYSVSGLTGVTGPGVTLNHDFGHSPVLFPSAVMAKSFDCCDYLLRADAVVNVCKLKTHGLMNLSAACKNLFGSVPGVEKPEYHYRFPDVDDFADMLVDLCSYLKPVLSVCDAVVGMEGNGPTAGTPRRIGAVLAAASPHALDLVAAGLIGLSPDRIPTLTAAIRRGLVPADASALKVFGDPAAFAVPDYRLILSDNSFLFHSRAKTPMARLTSSLLKPLLQSRPTVRSGCVGCGRCAEVCPAKAIVIRNKKAVIDRSACIRCFCCQEFCPAGAMRVHRTLISRLVTGNAKRSKAG